MLKGKGIISDLQKRLLLALHNLSDTPYFYLTVGTALAEFYFGHRKSYDLDIFTSEQGLVLPFSRIVEEKFKKNFANFLIITDFHGKECTPNVLVHCIRIGRLSSLITILKLGVIITMIVYLRIY